MNDDTCTNDYDCPHCDAIDAQMDREHDQTEDIEAQ